jgi:hypothetical protein
MWKDSAVSEPPKATAPAVTSKPVTEDELRTILDRLESTRDIFRENRELRDVLSRRESESQVLRHRNAELEDIMRKFAPMLLNVATTMGLAAKTEMRDSRNEA